MKLRKVTFTGMGGEFNVNDQFSMMQLVKDHPYLEFGMLAHPKYSCYRGSPEVPTIASIHSLITLFNVNWFAKENNLKLNMALHVCSLWSEDMVRGGTDFIHIYKRVLPYAQRIQLNIKNIDLDPAKAVNFAGTLKACGLQDKEIIFQVFDHNVPFAERLRDCGIKTSVLFDESRGLGVLPDQRRAPLIGFSCGYAGGLGPQNLTEELQKIKDNTPADYETWIDMQRHVRTKTAEGPEVGYFDVEKVKACLELAKPYTGESQRRISIPSIGQPQQTKTREGILP
jgi:hypothetical protein